MDKSAIVSQLDRELSLLIHTLESVPAELFFQRTRADKWSVAENAHHLMLAVRPLNLAFRLPHFVIGIFGKPNRQGRTYDQVVARYQQRLGEGAKASLPYVPPRKFSVSQTDLMLRLVNQYKTFASLVGTKSEHDLDSYLLPHPIMGKITLREMCFFTAYHIGHHHKHIHDRISDRAR